MKNIIVFILIINFFSCSYENEFDQEVVTIDIDLNKSIQGKLSDQFESPEYILLDFSDNNPLINLYNIIFKDEMIFIRDNRSNNLFIFNENGKVVDIINANGMGPGEFSQMDDFQVTEDRIFIQDTYLHKQLEFDRSGKFIKEIKNRYNNTNFYVGEKYSIYFLSY
ncbi:MAG: 6-bladed beta-propeller [Cyclobacteriaceae bacterium]